MGILLWAGIAALVIGIIFEIADLYSDGGAFTTGLIFAVIIIGFGHFFLLFMPDTTYTFKTSPVEFQQIEGEYFTPQGNDYVVKFNGNIQTFSKSMFYTVQSDSVYNEIQYKTGITNEEKYDIWMIGKQENDTMTYINKFILHRNLN